MKADEGSVAVILTRRASVEVVVILGDIGQDAEAVGDLKSHHVFCVQQGGNSQLLLRNSEGLEISNTLIRPRGRKEKRLLSCQIWQPGSSQIT